MHAGETEGRKEGTGGEVAGELVHLPREELLVLALLLQVVGRDPALLGGQEFADEPPVLLKLQPYWLPIKGRKERME